MKRIHLTREQLSKRWNLSLRAIERLKSAGVITTLAGLYDIKLIEALEAVKFPTSHTETNK